MIELKANITDHGASICHVRFWELANQHGLHHWCEMGWPCDLGGLPEALRTEASEWMGACQQGVGIAELEEYGIVAVRSSLSNGVVTVIAAAASKEAAGEAVGWGERTPSDG